MNRLVMPSVAVIAVTIFGHGAAHAASFDCSKARTPHEKHVCASMDLNTADAKMGEAYRAVLQSFPVKGFVLTTQRRFLLDYGSCDTSSGIACAPLLAERTATLQSMVNSAAVYADTAPAKSYSPDDGVLWIVTAGTAPVLHYFGSFMPDMNTPEPFPQGFVCDDTMPLQQTSQGYHGAEHGSDVTVTDAKLTARISCSPRNGLFGEYPRVR